MKSLIQQIKPSSTISINDLANKLIKEGKDILKFGIGEPDFHTPENIKQAAKKAIDEDFSYYTNASGIPELKEAICQKFRRENNIEYSPQEIFTSNGAKQVLYCLFQAVLEEGDEVILPSPYWVTYYEQIRLAGGQAIETDEECDCKITAACIEKAITPKTKIILLNTPSNPTGLIIEPEEIEKIEKIAVENNIFVISDEVYEHIIYDNKKHLSIASLGEDIKKLTFTVNAVSKTYAMTGWRLGYVGGPQNVLKDMYNLQTHLSSNPCNIAQKAAVEALNGQQDSVKEMIKEFDKRRQIVEEGFSKLKGFKCHPCEAAFYAWIDIREHLNDNMPTAIELAGYILEKTGIVVVPGNDFGPNGGNYIRFSYASSTENIKEAFRRLNKIF